MNLDGNTLTIIVDSHIALTSIDVYFEEIHFPISLVVICSINQDLIKDFIESWNILNLLIGEFEIGFPKNPFR